MNDLFEMPEQPKKPRPTKKGRQVYKGIRFSVSHPVLGRAARHCRNWPGLSREMGTYRAVCRRDNLNFGHVTIMATDDDGETWRQATLDEQVSYNNWKKGV